MLKRLNMAIFRKTSNGFVFSSKSGHRPVSPIFFETLIPLTLIFNFRAFTQMLTRRKIVVTVGLKKRCGILSPCGLGLTKFSQTFGSRLF